MPLKFNLAKIRKILLIAFVAVGIFSGGYFLGVEGYKVKVEKALNVQVDRNIPPEKDVEFALFWRVWDTLSAKYFDKTRLVPSEMVYGAIQGMVSAVGDPYTVFLKPSENKIVREDLNGSFEGVGIQIGFRSARLVVIAPLPDSPAEKAGIKAGDFIIHIKDEAKEIDMGTGGIALSEAVAAIRGKAGSEVTLTLAREGVEEPIVVTVERERLEVPSVTLEYVGESKKIAHIKVIKFSSETASEWDEKVSEIVKDPSVDSIVLDLRNNPGGYLQAAVELASDFMEVGKVVVIEEKSSGAKNEFKVERIGKLLKYKVVVLINEGSASASEILAGALRDQKGITLIGEKSFGKGTIQEPIEINGGSGLHVTTARWLTPNGTWVNENGLDPDESIEDNQETQDDEQLQKAIETLN
jgi:carboxyl-terminal processing protease